MIFASFLAALAAIEAPLPFVTVRCIQSAASALTLAKTSCYHRISAGSGTVTMHQSIHLLLLVVSFALLCSQLLVRQKQLVHLLFAAFCGSVCLMAIKRLGGADLGLYQYLVGMGICMTCNGYWLLSRAMFRKQDAINWQHVLVAGSIALLIVASQGLSLLQQLWPAGQPLFTSSRVIVNELLNLFSSTILMLTAWEACRGYAQTQGAERRHRQLFLATFGSAVTVCAIIAKIWLPAQGAALQMEVLSAGTAVAILVMTQWLIRQRFAAPTAESAGAAEPEHQPQAIANSVQQELQAQPAQPTAASGDSTVATALSQADLALFAQLQQLLFCDKLYLQANLRLTDVAQQLQVPEYRVSRLIRSQLHASNFNNFINTLRIEHAKSLLTDPAKQHWPVLVVGLESGFASVGPFTRAFKTQTGDTPNEYRLKQREPAALADWVHS